MLADVVLPSRRFQVFTYKVPLQFREALQAGSPVAVPLGSSVVSGLVVSVYEHKPAPTFPGRVGPATLRAILAVESDSEQATLGHNLFQLVRKVSDYYLAPLPACLRLIVPPHSVRVVKRLFLTEPGRRALQQEALSNEERVVLEKLARAPEGLLRSSVTRSIKTASSLLSLAKKKGWILEKTQVPATARSSKGKAPKPSMAMPTVVSQLDVFDQSELGRENTESRTIVHAENSCELRIVRALEKKVFQEIAIVDTEARRYQILVETIRAICPYQRQSIVLLPEIHQVETMARHLGQIWGHEVEYFHGHLSLRERSARWERIRQGSIAIVVGTRSALFLPLDQLGLVWIEHEEDSSYKEERLPYYHAREVARMRGEVDGALVVYGSAHPSMETYACFGRQTDILSHSTTLQNSRSMSPHVQIVDLTPLAFDTILSPEALDAVIGTLEAGKQVICLLNRKGFSRTLICRDCGQAPSCAKCGVSLRLFQRPTRMVCSYCDISQSAPKICPACHGHVFRYSGTGIQRLEDELGSRFPSYRMARIDRENINMRNEALLILQQFRQKEIRLLIGTEFLLHQPLRPTAALVLLPQADLTLHIPDFRSAERTFRMFSQAVAMAQDDSQPGRVILQTRMSDHHVLRAIQCAQPSIFYEHELALREALDYPPLTHLILVVVMGPKAERVTVVVNYWKEQFTQHGLGGPALLEETTQLSRAIVLGPLTSKKPGSGKKNRTLFLIKTTDLDKTQGFLRDIQRRADEKFSREAVISEINVDPLDIQ